MTDTALTAKVRLRVEGMDCSSCAAKIENALNRMPGVSEVVVSVPAGTVTVTQEGTEVDDKIRKQISDLGYRVTGKKEDIGNKHLHHEQGERTSIDDQADIGFHEHAAARQCWWQTRKGLLTIASGSALGMTYLLGKLIPATERWNCFSAFSCSIRHQKDGHLHRWPSFNESLCKATL
jgi:Zn2+/Cd2+-exporting ATPase